MRTANPTQSAVAAKMAGRGQRYRMAPSRRQFFAAMGVAGAGAEAACGVGDSAGSGQGQPSAAPAAIRLSVWADVQDWDVYSAIIKDFQEAHPNVQVAGEQYTGAGVNYYDKMQTLFASGDAADVNYIQGWIWQPYALQDLLLPLDTLIGKDKAMQRLVSPNYEAQSKLRGKTYMLTADTSPMVMFYNKSLFDRAGVPYPTEGWTLDDLVDKARKLTRQDAGQQYWGYQANGGYLRNFPWIRLNGAREWDRIVEPKQSKWDSANVAKELQLQLGDLINRFRVAPARTAPAEQNQIQFGFAAMKMEGPWFLPRTWGSKANREGGLAYDVAVMPRGTEQHAVHLQHGHTVNAKTVHQDAAWQLLTWIASDQGQRRIAEGGRMCNLPENNEKIWGPIASKDYNFQHVQAFLHTQKMGSIDVVGGVSEAQITRDGGLGDAINDILDGKATAKEALAVAHPKIQALLDQYWAQQGGK
jgi:multiple sugar transport system substrate-binding protein